MRDGPGEEDEVVAVDLVDQQPVGLDVAAPVAGL
jgi:hypothetical protein